MPTFGRTVTEVRAKIVTPVFLEILKVSVYIAQSELMQVEVSLAQLDFF